MKYNHLYKKNLSFAAARSQKNPKRFDNRPGETLSQTILYLETHDYQINFVNIDSCHQYGIFWAILRRLSCKRSIFFGEEFIERDG